MVSLNMHADTFTNKRPNFCILPEWHGYILLSMHTEVSSQVKCLFNVIESDSVRSVQSSQLLHFTQEHHIPSVGPNNVCENLQHMP